MTVYVPGHAKRPHDWFDKARAWLSARLPRRQWIELDDDGQDIADIFECEQCAYDEGECTCIEFCGQIVCMAGLDDEDVPGVAEPLPGPGYHHHDAPAVVVPAVQLSDGSYAGLSGTIPANLPRPGREVTADGNTVSTYREPAEDRAGPGQPHRWPRPEPHAGSAAWHPARPPLQPWIQAILGAPSVEAWAWGWQQKRRLAISA
jgi:hypothetical protein